MCTSSSTTSGCSRRDHLDRLVDRAGVADHVDAPAELGAHAGAEELVVVDEHDARRSAHASRSSIELDLGAVAGRVRSRRVPPWRAIRPTIDSRMPRRSSGTAARSKPGAAVADEHLDAARASTSA